MRRGRRRTVSHRLRVIGGDRLDWNDPQSAFDWQFLRKKSAFITRRGARAIRVVDLFSGCGGLSLGVREACVAAGYSFKPLIAVDSDAVSLGVYEKNLEPSRTHLGDVWDILDGKCGSPPTRTEDLLIRSLGRTDILLAGPPCQGHSDLNNHTRRIDTRNHLYERVGRFAEIVKPQHILVENVPSVIHSRDRVLEATARILMRNGYAVDHGVMDLSSLGVPQRRKRHVLVATRGPRFSVSAIMAAREVQRPRSVAWAIGDLQDERANGIFTSATRHMARTAKRIDYLFDNDRYDLPNRLRPRCHQNGQHSYISMYGRLKLDRPAQTITGGFGCPGQGRFVHPTRRRALTPHEAARLQCFPDFFDFSGVETRTALAQMIGNAAPPQLSYIFALAFLSK